MSPKMSVTIKGEKELQRKFEELGIVASVPVAKATTATAAEVIRKEAARRAPVLTSKLSRNIAVNTRKAKDGATTKVGPAKEVWYGRFPELGTKSAPAKPFLRPAFDTKKQEAQNLAAARLRREIKRAIR